MDYHEFKRLVNKRKQVGERRRKILGFIAKNPESTPYRIAKAIYSDPLVYHRTVSKMLEHIEKEVPGIFEIRTEEGIKGKVKFISLSGKGKDFCKREGIIVPTMEADFVIKFISSKMPENAPLSFEESGELYQTLTEKVCKTALEIYRSTHPMMFEGDIGYQILFGVWAYENGKETKRRYKLIPKNISALYMREINAGLISRKEIIELAKKESEKVFPQIDEFEALKLVKLHEAEGEFNKFLSVLDPIVKRALFLINLKEDAMRSHQAYILHKLFGSIPFVVKRILELEGVKRMDVKKVFEFLARVPPPESRKETPKTSEGSGGSMEGMENKRKGSKKD